MKKLFLIAMGLFWIPVVWADLNDGLVAHYPFNGNALDESGNGNHGTVHGAMLTEDRFGKSDGAYSFDGKNDYIISSPNLPIGNSVRSISVWFKSTSDSGYNGWYTNTVTSWGNASDNNNCDIAFYQGKLLFGAFANDVRTDVLVNDGSWHHVVVIHNGTILKIYLDHEVIASNKIRELNTTNSSFYIGKRSGQSNQHMDGVVDDVRIYNRALTESEIQQLYQLNNQTLPSDSSCTETDLEKARNQAKEEAKKACQANPTSCGIDLNGEVASAVIESDLSLHVSKA
jgi:hypothetical protein